MTIMHLTAQARWQLAGMAAGEWPQLKLLLAPRFVQTADVQACNDDQKPVKLVVEEFS